MSAAFFRSLTRPLVTYAFTIAVIAGFLLGRVSADQFMGLAIMVIGMWFGSRTPSK